MLKKKTIKNFSIDATGAINEDLTVNDKLTFEDSFIDHEFVNNDLEMTK